MTCIVGFVEKKHVYMAGDHMGSDGYSDLHYNNQKVFINGDFIIGYCGSFRMGQILQYDWVQPKRPKTMNNDLQYIVKLVVPSIMKAFDCKGFLQTAHSSDEAGQKLGGNFLLGYKGKLYHVQADFSVLEDTRGYDAVGCGLDFAKGALYWLSKDDSLSPADKLRKALEATEEHSTPVRVDWDRFVVIKK